MISSASQAQILNHGRRVLLAAAVCVPLLWMGGPLLRLITATALIVLAPGYLLERLLPAPRLPLLMRSALWVALSLSVVVLLYEAAWLTEFRLSTPILMAFGVFVASGAFVAAWIDLQPRYPSESPPLQNGTIWLAFGVVCLMSVSLRFTQIEGLALPPWVDSVHHALLVRISAEQGGLPIDLRPYMPIGELTYHWGFHVVAAALMQLSGVDLGNTLLWSGQLLNALHAPLAGALALLLHRKPVAALGTALSVGLLSYFPAYYLSWGRYTQLTGLLLVPALAIVWQTGLERSHWRWWVAAALLLAGLLLIHVRVLLFVLTLLAVQTVFWALRRNPTELKRAAIGICGAGMGAAILGAPWVLLLARRIVPTAVAQPENFVASNDYAAISTALLWAGDGRWLSALALLAAGWGIWRRQVGASMPVIWVGILLFFAQPALISYVLPALGAVVLIRGVETRHWPFMIAGIALLLLNPLTLDLPPTWLISGDSVVISLFLPLSVALGGGLADLSTVLRRRGGRIAMLSLPLIAVGAIALGAWGAQRQQRIVNPGTIIATAADLKAIEWGTRQYAARRTLPDQRRT
ncbi:MAG: hypothetical protein HC822_25880, partial [Oscillochloris sp.]|nr:hypothetical protein [Oscillochloris sp.]